MATSLSNQANISYSYSSGGTGTAVSNTTTTTLLDEYSITATKTSFTDTYREGINLAYLIRIENNGTGTLYTVTASDDLGAGNLSYVPNSAVLIIGDEYYLISPTSSAPSLEFTLPIPLAPGEVAFIGYLANVISVPTGESTDITNTTDVTARSGSATGEIISVTPSPTATVTEESYADVFVLKEADKTTVNAGDTLTYTFTLTNTGNETAQGVVLSDTLPQGFTVTSVQSVTNGVVTTYSATDYSIDPATNTLVLPYAGSLLTITVPAQSVTTIIVGGTVE